MLLAPEALAPLVALAATDGVPLVDRLEDHAGLAPLPPRLHGADVAINLHGRGPQSHALLRAARPGRLVAFAAPPAHPDGPPWRADEHERARWCRLAADAGWPADPDDLRLAPPPAPPSGAGATLLHPGAASASRRWPVDRFAAVARAEADAGREVLVTGGPDEVELAREVARRAGLPADAVLAGRTDLAALAALVAHAGRLVCGDTGLAHLASALGTPSVLLFGPTPPATWGPPADGAHVVLWPAPAAGHRGDPHGAEPDPVLAAIAVDDVLAALAVTGRTPPR